MQVLITHGSIARTRVLQFSRLQIVGAALLLACLLMLASGAIYHFIFLRAVEQGWPVVSQIVRLVVRDEFAQRDRFMRENLDAMAQKVGEMQAKLITLEAMGDRVSSLAGIKPEELKPLQHPAPGAGRGITGGQGGPYVPLSQPTLLQLQQRVAGLEEASDENADIFTLAESRLLEVRLQKLMIPNSAPLDGPVGSGFGFRVDPITGRTALHTGLDFPADVGTPIHAAAGGLVRDTEHHPEYGNLIEIDHGNGLSTRYAHCSKVLVKAGDLVKRGQVVGLVGTTGRSTGPHLHFEVLVDGVPQNPERFLDGGRTLAARTARR